MTKLPPAQLSSERTLYLAVVIVSLMLSAWSGYAQQVPNPDGLYYLRAAEYFHAGQWAQGLAIYRWPFFSLTIAGVMALTGAAALVAAQVVNALLDCATAVIFVALVRRLAPEATARNIAIWAAFVIVLHPKLAGLRAMVIRDHGYYTFSLLALYLVVRDHQAPAFRVKLGIVASILAAALFRLEALLLLVVVPTFYLVSDTSFSRRRLLVIPAILAAALLLAIIYVVWSGTTMLPGARSGGLEADSLARFKEIGEAMRARAARLSEVVPPIRNAGVVAYIGFCAAALADALLRALTIPLAVLALFAFMPQRLLSGFASRFVLWFSGWQVAMLCAFIVIAFFIDWRFAMMFGLIMTIPAVFTVSEVAAQWQAGLRGSRLLLPIVLLAVIVPWIIDVPRFSKLEHLRTAGLWISQNVPSDAKVMTNDGRIAYFSGRSFQNEILLRAASEATPRAVSEVDYVAVEGLKNRPPSFISADLQTRMIATFDGANNRSVFIYKTR